MARLEGITGGLSGKMGSAVFRQSGGKTIASQYQPIVKNPNTQGQQTQRAKFKLMTQLAAIMAPGYGTMGTINRPARGKETQRNAFTRLNMPLVEVSIEGQETTAKIPMEQLKLTSSFRPMPQIEVTAATGSFNVALRSELTTDITTVRIVVVGYVDNVATIAEIRDVPADKFDSESVRFIVGAGNFTVLAYGLIPSESAKASIDLDNIHTPNDEDFISAIELNSMVENGSMAETKTVGANITVVQA